MLFMLAKNILIGQGCSDAGICTLDALKPNTSQAVSPEKNQIKMGLSYGAADHSITVLGQYLEYNRQLTGKWGLDVKTTALSQRGNDISAFGMSDLFVNTHFAVNRAAKLTLGVKVPLADGNRIADGRPLPMDYQSSLGTLDLIAGITWEIRRFQLVAALQQPLSQNQNTFFAEDYPVGSPLQSIASTNGFQRSGDVLLRVAYPFHIGQKLNITPGILPIYHLANDTYTAKNGAETAIEGSKGLTVNGNVYVDYAINDSNALQLNVGMPFVVRAARPDGLTRAYIANFEYRIRF